MKKLETASYVAVICSCALLTYVLLSQYVFRTHLDRNDPKLRQPAVGRTLQLTNVSWANANRSLVLAISSHCGYCIRSTAFYQKLSDKRRSQHAATKLIAVMSEDPSSATSFLERNGVLVDQVATAPLSALGVDATPTVLLVDNNGKVIGEWIGLLNPSAENQVMSQLD